MNNKIVYKPQITRRKKYKWLLVGAVILSVAVFTSLRPVPILPENELTVIKGKVLHIFQAGTKDVNFELQGRREIYYVNRGLLKGLDIQELRRNLIGKEIVLKYPEYWSLMSMGSKNIHVSKIEHGSKTIFTEIN